ncbi:hypothetical protein D1816_13640 [Aquimarina sp. AD10]|uniref:lipocalin family protein n=1 Tax=Aquimarina sp. AD10 TaxID=1714849 RepID=UPI000E51651B|nr:lipocalin family protein [Aquimarina sp. AD10]AXT61345.1 hypothetical protein D1816_13640 [Aquimarina sp. AD10]RKN01460.1 hypothetical protein D7033_04335 [Aquimarina sp. AD10]
MKKLSLFILLIAATFTSCSDDDESPATGIEITEANLIGNWKITAETENGNAVTLDNCDLFLTTQLFVNDQGENRATFIEGVEMEGICTPTTSDGYTWSLVSGNILKTETIDNIIAPDLEKIIELTASTLKLEYTETEGSEEIVIIETYTKL